MLNVTINLTIVPEFGSDKFNLLDTTAHVYVAQSVPREYTNLFLAAPAMLAALRTLFHEHYRGRYPLSSDWTEAARAINSAEGR